ncbi:hypothetical protein P4C99_18470 [Pontiellaceae bacterium B1224]|nr:hypothetical protein [Pontiellaceae bacterium B1224]
MKRLLIAAALISTGAYAEEAAKIQEPAEATVEKKSEYQWPNVNEWANKNKLKDGMLSVDILLGYEYEDQTGNATKPANAVVSRTRLTFKTANQEGFNTMIQAQYVGPLNNHYNPRNANYDTIMDPEAFRMQQAYLDYTGYDTLARVGAQEIILDNARFIGNVGWRFNAQSFNAGLIKNNSIENLTLLYSYAASINAIDGNLYTTRQYNLLNGQYKLNESNNASAFAYYQSNDNAANINTFGARIWGTNGKLTHDAMAAIQRRAYYGFLSGAMDLDTITVELGGEYLSGGDDTRERFQTLNGTAHKFNGWADQFIRAGNSTANGSLAAGLIDVWVKGTVSPMENMDLIGVYHYFNTAANTPATSFSGNYGNEIDAMLKYKFCKNFDALTGIAVYMKGNDSASNLTSDDTVFWLRGNLRF